MSKRQKPTPVPVFQFPVLAFHPGSDPAPEPMDWVRIREEVASSMEID